MLATLAVLLLAADPEPPTKLQAPAVKFTGSFHWAGHAWLGFEVSNPNSKPLPYAGYTSDSSGTIEPLCRVELCQGKDWKPMPLVWCVVGRGPVSIPARGKATFKVLLPGGSWDGVRVGLTWFRCSDRKGPEAAWSGAVSRQDATPSKAP